MWENIMRAAHAVERNLAQPSEERIPVRVSSLYHTRSIAAADVALRTAAISTMAVSALSCLRRAQYFGEGRYMANRPFINS